MKISIKDLIFMARVADQAERYDDMLDFLIQVVDAKDEELTADERNLLSVGFKNYISSARTAWRTIEAIEKSDKYTQYSNDWSRYKLKVLRELEGRWKRIISIIREKILPKSNEIEARAFYLKMIGDYYRYIAENARGDTLIEASDCAIEYYVQADLVARDMKPYHVTKLSLVLNLSVFYYEVKDDIQKACALAKEALHNAKLQIENMNNEDAKDALSIVALLKENLSLWKEEAEEDEAIAQQL